MGTCRVTFRQPDALDDPNDDAKALALLLRYYGEPFATGPYTGARFDLWDSTGTRDADADRFTADDLVAVTFLSVDVPGRAAIDLLGDRADEINAALAAVGPDRDLADEPGPASVEWPAWRLEALVRSLPGVGRVTATKLLARKRPRLVPVWDAVVGEVTATHDRQWEPLRAALAADGHALHRRLLRLREQASLPDQVSALRVLDVVCWMEGKAKGFGAR